MLLQSEEQQMAGSGDEISARSPVTMYSGEPLAFMWQFNLSSGIRVTSYAKWVLKLSGQYYIMN